MWQDSYEAPDKGLWFGRIDEGVKALRYHQTVRLIDASKNGLSATDENNIAIVGFKCDEGVKRNKGRPGAYPDPMLSEKIRRPILS